LKVQTAKRTRTTNYTVTSAQHVHKNTNRYVRNSRVGS